MSGAVGSLNREDRVVLRENFQVYDPDTGCCHTDFSVLNGVRVIF